MKKFVNFRFSYPLIAGILLGILTCRFFYSGNFEIILLDVAIVGLFVFFFYSEKKKLIISLAVIVVLFTFSALLYRVLLERYLSLSIPEHKVYYISGKVKSVSYFDDYVCVKLSNATIEYDFKLVDTSLIVYVENGSAIEIGDKIEFYSVVTRMFSKSDTSFLYEGITYKSFVSIEDVVYLGSKLSVFEKCNVYVKNLLFSYMDKSVAGIAYAMLTGTTSFIPQDVNDLYRFAGIAHIFAVSGLHISFISHFLNRITKRIPIKQIYKSLFIIVLLVFYSGVCNFTASSLRAVIMCSVLLFCQSFGKKYDILNAMLISMAMLLIFNPFSIFNIGFQLSYLSLLGIIILANSFKRLLKFLPEKISSSASVSLASCVTTLPVMMKVFGYFSPLSILYNLVIIPIIYVIFLGLILTLLVGFIIKLKVVFFLADKTLGIINKLLYFTHPERYIVKGKAFGYGVIFYYSGVFIGSDLINLDKTKKLIFCLLFINVFLLFLVF